MRNKIKSLLEFLWQYLRVQNRTGLVYILPIIPEGGVSEEYLKKVRAETNCLLHLHKITHFDWRNQTMKLYVGMLSELSWDKNNRVWTLTNEARKNSLPVRILL